MAENNGIITLFKKGLRNTSSKISSIFTGNKIDDETWELLEEQMILADIGAVLTMSILDKVKTLRSAVKSPDALLAAIKNEIGALFLPCQPIDVKPYVIVVIGVNGAGKTTTIAKLAHRFKSNGDKVLLCAADTFRAGAIDQLKVWANRTGVDIIAPAEGTDPAAVSYDAVNSAKSKGYDRLIIDTAGRLHTKHNLMEELKKIIKVVDKAFPGAPHEIMLVVDGTTGQNALNQAKVFNDAVKIDSVAVTKLDGTAKGGIVANIAYELKIPVKYVGLGEQENDLIPFDKEAYLEAIFNIES